MPEPRSTCARSGREARAPDVRSGPRQQCRSAACGGGSATRRSGPGKTGSRESGASSSVRSRSFSASVNAALSMSALASRTANRTLSTGSLRCSAASSDSGRSRRPHRGCPASNRRGRACRPRPDGRRVWHDSPRLLEPADRLDTPRGRQAGRGRQGLGPVRRRLRSFQGRLKHRPRLVGLVEPQGELGVHEARGRFVALCSGREVVLAHPETPTHLAQELEGRNPVAGLDPRDVGRRTAGARAGVGSALRAHGPDAAGGQPRPDRQHESIFFGARGPVDLY